MVAIKGSPFNRIPGDESPNFEHVTYQNGPLTPTASDCLSQSGQSTSGELSDDGGSTAAASQEGTMGVERCLVKRDPSLLMDRLENCVGRRRIGRRKRRQARNEAALAALVEGYEEDPDTLYVKPYCSAFTKLLESPFNMMVWYHFTNLSEEDQRLYLAGPRSRAKLHKRLERPEKPATATIAASGCGLKKVCMCKGADKNVRGGASPVTDKRIYHPAAFPSSSGSSKGRSRESSCGSCKDSSGRSSLHCTDDCDVPDIKDRAKQASSPKGVVDLLLQESFREDHFGTLNCETVQEQDSSRDIPSDHNFTGAWSTVRGGITDALDDAEDTDAFNNKQSPPETAKTLVGLASAQVKCLSTSTTGEVLHECSNNKRAKKKEGCGFLSASPAETQNGVPNDITEPFDVSSMSEALLDFSQSSSNSSFDMIDSDVDRKADH